MKTRVFILHGWCGVPRGSWRGWLADRLVEMGAEVHVLSLPTPEQPKCNEWVEAIQKAVGRARSTDIAPVITPCFRMVVERLAALLRGLFAQQSNR